MPLPVSRRTTPSSAARTNVRVPLVLGVQGDDPDAVAVLGVELAHGPDQAHGGLAPVHHSDAFEHPSDPLSVNPTLRST